MRDLRRIILTFYSVLWLIGFGVVQLHAQQTPGPSATSAPADPVPSQMRASTVASAATGDQQQVGEGAGAPLTSKGRFVWVANDGTTWWTSKTNFELWLAGIIVFLLIMLVGILCTYARLSNVGLTAEFQRTFLLLTVVFSALFLIAAGYSDQQTAPVFSLLGAIIGYLFGRAPGVEPASQTEPSNSSKTQTNTGTPANPLPGSTSPGSSQPKATQPGSSVSNETPALVEPSRPGQFPP